MIHDIGGLSIGRKKYFYVNRQFIIKGSFIIVQPSAVLASTGAATCKNEFKFSLNRVDKIINTVDLKGYRSTFTVPR